ncbi:MAG: M4 family metallopeptidase, partial [Bacillota bacterium]
MKRIVTLCIIFALTISSFSVSTGFAANSNKANRKAEIKVKKFIKSDIYDAPGYVSGTLTLPTKEDPVKIVKRYTGLKAKDNDLIVHKKFRNKQSETVVKTEQTYKGIKVRGTFQSFIVDKDGVIKTVSGTNIPDIETKIKGNFSITENEALEISFKDLNREAREAGYTLVEKTLLPNNEGVLCAYSVKISFYLPSLESWEYIIDASSGKIIEKRDALMYESVQVSGYGPFKDFRDSLNGYRGPIPDIKVTPRYEYSLADTTRTAPADVIPVPFKILTYSMTTGRSMNGIVPWELDNYREIASDSDGAFIEDSRKYHEVDAHYFTGKVYEYYKNRFGRYSFDNKGKDMIINCHALFTASDGTTSPNNACYDTWSRQIFLGDGDGRIISTFATPETIGHEFTHAIIDNDSQLQLFYQSGAIHEGLADLFGEAIESYAYETAPDWKKMTAGFTPDIPGDALIDYKNPKEVDYPDHMEDIYQQSSDKLGVHINAAILTKAFSLMSDGGWFHNVAVEGIGIDKVSEVMYKVINEYLSSNTNFVQFAEASVDAAAKIYGEGSREYYSIRAGFHAVGILNSVSQWNRVGESSFELLADTFTTCQLGNKIYVIGGCRDEAMMDYSTELWEYDILLNRWTRKSDMIGPRVYARSIAVGGKIYLLYGQDDIFMESAVTRIDQYDPASDKWSVVSTLPYSEIIPFGQYSAGSIITKSISNKENLLEIKTGQIGAGGSINIKIQGSSDNQIFTDVNAFNPITVSNSTVKYCITDRSYSYYRVVAEVNGAPCTFGLTGYYYKRNTAVAAYDNKLYIIGGSDFTNEYNTSMDIFDTVANQWTLDLQGLEYGRNNPVAALVARDNVPKIYVLFGERYGSDDPTYIEVYDINTGSWSLEGTCPNDITISSPAVTVFKGKLHFVGGRYLYGPTVGNGTTLVYDPATKQWTKDIIPGIASLNGILAVYDSHMYFVGSMGSTVGWIAPVSVDVFEPLRVDGYENSNTIVIQWTKFDNSTSTELTIDGSTKYTGTETSYRYISYNNRTKKHIIKVTQNHPLYGTISSKNLCSVYQVIGDLSRDDMLSDIDVYLLEDYLQGIASLTNTQKVAADVNGDNIIDSMDLNILKDHIMNFNYSYQRIGRIEF